MNELKEYVYSIESVSLFSKFNKGLKSLLKDKGFTEYKNTYTTAVTDFELLYVREGHERLFLFVSPNSGYLSLYRNYVGAGNCLIKLAKPKNLGDIKTILRLFGL